MAHFIIEYSANLPKALLDVPGLMARLHEAAAETGVFPRSGMRSRAHCCDEFRVGDGNPDNGFVNVSMRVGRGRTAATRAATGKILFDALLEHLQPVLAARGLAISFEMRELDAHVKFNHKNI